MMKRMGNVPGLGRKMKKGKKGKKAAAGSPPRAPANAGQAAAFDLPGIGIDRFPGLN